MIKEEVKFQNSNVFEGMVSIRSIIKANENGNNDRRIEKILYDISKIKKIGKNVGYLKAVSNIFKFEILESNEKEIGNLTLGNSHGGLIAITTDRTFKRLSAVDNIFKNGFYCMLQGIEDPYNFGYSLRSLYACGCSGIILPERNWMNAAGVVSRSSAGASELFDIYVASAEEAVSFFKENGYTVVCADEKTDNILGQCSLKKPIFLIVGGEKRGISQFVLDKADFTVKINYSRNFNASLSAASATTMFAYEISRQNID